jgi:hypothetical protein
MYLAGWIQINDVGYMIYFPAELSKDESYAGFFLEKSQMP